MSQRSSWGRWQPKKITPELVEEAAKHFSSGASSYKIVAAALGVPPSIFRTWVNDGEKQLVDIYEAGKGYPSQTGLLYQAVLEAVGRGRIDLVEGIRAGEKEWKALSWLLERVEREDYGAREQEERGPVTIIVQSAFPGVSPAEVIEVRAAEVRELPVGDA